MNLLRKCVFGLAILSSMFVGGQAFAQDPTPQESAFAEMQTAVATLSQQAANQTTSMLTTVAGWGILLLVIAGGIGLVFYFFKGAKARA